MNVWDISNFQVILNFWNIVILNILSRHSYYTHVCIFLLGIISGVELMNYRLYIQPALVDMV